MSEMSKSTRVHEFSRKKEVFAAIGLVLLFLRASFLFGLIVLLLFPSMFAVNLDSESQMESLFTNALFMKFFVLMAVVDVLGIGMVLYSFYVLKVRRLWFYWSMQVAVLIMFFLIPPFGIVFAMMTNHSLRKYKLEFRKS